MSSNPTTRTVDMPDRLCYFCNEGRCANCTGWDRTVINGEIVIVACAHECRSHGERKPVQRVSEPLKRRRA